MANETAQAFEAYFTALKDPRIDRKKLYPLMEILFVVLRACLKSFYQQNNESKHEHL